MPVLVFDLDGTLVDSMPALAAVATDILCRSCAFSPDVARDHYFATSGRPFADQLQVIRPNNPSGNIALAAEFERRKQYISMEIGLSPATRATLIALRRRGLRLAISSSCSQPLLDLFMHTHKPPVDIALGHADGSGKGLSHFRTICGALGCQLSDLVFIGDSLFDATVAAQAGVAFIAKVGTLVKGQFTMASEDTRCIEHIAELDALYSTMGVPDGQEH